jgi:hypothetical protein
MQLLLSGRSILVVGAGRSGTSTVARILHENLNVNMSPPFYNNKYESQLFRMLNRSLVLGEMNYKSWLPKVNELIIAAESEKRTWGFKDPLIAYTLGLYLSLLHRPVIIWAYRDVEQVSESMKKNYKWYQIQADKEAVTRTTMIYRCLSRVEHMKIDFSKGFISDERIEAALEEYLSYEEGRAEEEDGSDGRRPPNDGPTFSNARYTPPAFKDTEQMLERRDRQPAEKRTKEEEGPKE